MKRLIIALLLGLTACSQSTAIPISSPSPTATSSPTPPASPISTPSGNPCIIDNLVYCALNPDVAGDSIGDGVNNFASTICKKNWTKLVRPPQSFTDDLKRQRMEVKGYDMSTISNYELDHRMPLELGGAPGSADLSLQWENINLSLESPASPNPKDGDETSLHDKVCQGKLSLSVARTQLVSKWLLPGDRYKQ